VSIFYIDASIPEKVYQALAAVRTDVLYPGTPGCLITDRAMKDREWLQIVGEHEWVVLMRDKHIRSRPGQRNALFSHGVRAFVLTTAGNYSGWRTLHLLVRRWDEIEQVVATVPGPFLYAVTQQGLREIPLAIKE
jgi:PIN like domain